MKRYISLLCVVLLLLAFQLPAFAATYGSYSDAMNGVARVFAEADTYVDGDYYDVLWGTGSAFAVGEKNKPVTYFVTNRHVINWEDEIILDDNGKKHEVRYEMKAIYVIMDDNSIRYQVSIVTDNEGGVDLAILKLREATDKREPCILRPYDDALKLVGSSVWSVGYPGAQKEYMETKTIEDELMSSKNRISVGKGVFSAEIDSSVSALGGTLIQTDATINHGNSGGPLVDEKGAVLGVCTYSVEGAQGINAAVSVNEVIKLLDQEKIPYLTVKSVPESWYIYVILGVAIVAVLAFLVVALKRKPKGNGGKKAGAASYTPGKTIATDNPPPSPVKSAETRILVGVSGALEGKRYTLKAKDKLLIGRDRSQCNVVFPEGTPGVSRIHCNITFDGKSAVITDLRSSSGTFVDGKKLAENVPTRLHRGLSVDIGSDKNRFTLQ